MGTHETQKCSFLPLLFSQKYLENTCIPDLLIIIVFSDWVLEYSANYQLQVFAPGIFLDSLVSGEILVSLCVGGCMRDVCAKSILTLIKSSVSIYDTLKPCQSFASKCEDIKTTQLLTIISDMTLSIHFFI